MKLVKVDKICKSSKQPLGLKVRSERVHHQVITNRKRHLYVEKIDQHRAWLIMQTEITNTTTQHRSNGQLRTTNMTNHRANNLGLVSRYLCTDLVKLIYTKDVPQIVHDFQSGKALNQIRYSSWPTSDIVTDDNDNRAVVNHVHHNGVNNNWTVNQIDHNNVNVQLLDSSFDVKNSFYAASHKNATFTNRIIKSVSSLVGL